MLNRYSNPFPFSGDDTTMCEKCSFSPPTQSAVTSSDIIVSGHLMWKTRTQAKSTQSSLLKERPNKDSQPFR